MATVLVDDDLLRPAISTQTVTTFAIVNLTTLRLRGHGDFGIASRKRQLDDWKVANPTCQIVKEGAAVAAGEGSIMLDEPVWALTIEFDEP